MLQVYQPSFVHQLGKGEKNTELDLGIKLTEEMELFWFNTVFNSFYMFNYEIDLFALFFFKTDRKQN